MSLCKKQPSRFHKMFCKARRKRPRIARFPWAGTQRKTNNSFRNYKNVDVGRWFSPDNGQQKKYENLQASSLWAAGDMILTITVSRVVDQSPFCLPSLDAHPIYPATRRHRRLLGNQLLAVIAWDRCTKRGISWLTNGDWTVKTGGFTMGFTWFLPKKQMWFYGDSMGILYWYYMI